MNTVFDFFNPSWGKTYSHINPWYEAMEHFTDEIGWTPPVYSGGRIKVSSPRHRIQSSFNKWTRRTMKTVFDFFNPSWGKTYSHINPWYAAMEHFTDEIGWTPPVPSRSRIKVSSPVTVSTTLSIK